MQITPRVQDSKSTLATSFRSRKAIPVPLVSRSAIVGSTFCTGGPLWRTKNWRVRSHRPRIHLLQSSRSIEGAVLEVRGWSSPWCLVEPFPYLLIVDLGGTLLLNVHSMNVADLSSMRTYRRPRTADPDGTNVTMVHERGKGKGASKTRLFQSF